jgi:hypothetical protein
MVQTLFAPDGDVNLEQLWKEIGPEQLMDSKLKCVFEMPVEQNESQEEPTKASPKAIVASVPNNAVDPELQKAAEEVNINTCGSRSSFQKNVRFVGRKTRAFALIIRNGKKREKGILKKYFFDKQKLEKKKTTFQIDLLLRNRPNSRKIFNLEAKLYENSANCARANTPHFGKQRAAFFLCLPHHYYRSE